jgi:hypothetical protein
MALAADSESLDQQSLKQAGNKKHDEDVPVLFVDSLNINVVF